LAGWGTYYTDDNKLKSGDTLKLVNLKVYLSYKIIQNNTYAAMDFEQKNFLVPCEKFSV